jgi:hypothetical protein
LISAFLVNDLVCLVMTPFVLHVARRLGPPPLPYLLGVAIASNVGNTATSRHSRSVQSGCGSRVNNSAQRRSLLNLSSSGAIQSLG